jgi:hypothetical protein
MIDRATSEAVLEHLRSGGCISGIDVRTLAAGQLATKCGVIPATAKKVAYTHDTLHFKEAGTAREFVVVMLTKGDAHEVMEDLFKDLVALIP